jgi:hypothetical protein
MRTIYLYLNYLNQAVYIDFRDSIPNKYNKQLKRFTFTDDNTLKIFMRYYQIKIHPKAL